MEMQKLVLEQELEELMDKMESETWKVTVICIEMMMITTLLALIFNWPLLVSRVVVGLFTAAPLVWWLAGYFDKIERITIRIGLLDLDRAPTVQISGK